jgi:hypothetical protein
MLALVILGLDPRTQSTRTASELSPGTGGDFAPDLPLVSLPALADEKT